MDRIRRHLQGLARRWFAIRNNDCGPPNLRGIEFGDNLDGPPDGAQVEHPLPVRIHSVYLLE